MRKIDKFKKFDFNKQLDNLYQKTNIWNENAWLVEPLNNNTDDEGVFIFEEKYLNINESSYSLIFIKWDGDEDEGEYEFTTIENYIYSEKEELLNKNSILEISKKILYDHKKNNQIKKFNI